MGATSNTYLGLMIPSLTSTFGIFLMRQFIILIPDDLIDAARIDGCSDIRIYWHVVLPLIKPALGTLTIFTFMWNWDMSLWPLVMVDKRNLFTVPLGLGSFLIRGYTTQFNLFLAATTLTVLPVIIVFLIGRKQIVKGVALTGFK
jgi:multiple sugar transport system permease protein